MKSAMMMELKKPMYVEQKPYIGDDGVYIPVEQDVLEGTVSAYRCILTKEMFIDAYNKWIKCE